MTDLTGADDIGNPNDGAGEGGEGQTLTPDTLFAELDEATRNWVQTRHENSVTKLAKQAFEADKFAGSAVQVPKDDASAEDWDKFYAKIGRPEDASKYDFKPPESMPKDAPYSEDLANGFREKAFSIGLSGKQAAELHDWFAVQQAEAMKTAQGTLASQTAASVEAANAALVEAWGERGGEAYNAQLEMAGRFFEAIDEKGTLGEALSKAGLLGPNREVLVPELAIAMAKAGAAIFTEGSTLTEGDSLTGVNPFEGEGNLTAAMMLVRDDPHKARMMAKAAGANLADYGLQ